LNLIEAHLRNGIQHLRSEHKKGEEKEVETILPTHIEILNTNLLGTQTPL
jgi:hypothetical protein